MGLIFDLLQQGCLQIYLRLEAVQRVEAKGRGCALAATAATKRGGLRRGAGERTATSPERCGLAARLTTAEATGIKLKDFVNKYQERNSHLQVLLIYT